MGNIKSKEEFYRAPPPRDLFLDLPEELLPVIMAFLDATSLKRLHRVNKRFHRVSKEALWEKS